MQILGPSPSAISGNNPKDRNKLMQCCALDFFIKHAWWWSCVLDFSQDSRIRVNVRIQFSVQFSTLGPKSIQSWIFFCVTCFCHLRATMSLLHVANVAKISKILARVVFVTFLDDFQKVVYQNSRYFNSEFMLATVQWFRILEKKLKPWKKLPYLFTFKSRCPRWRIFITRF